MGVALASQNVGQAMSHSFLVREKYMDNDGYLALQGAPTLRLALPPRVTSSQFGGMVGDAMGVK